MAQTFHITLDVKITSGKPKILEFQTESSFSGYDKLGIRRRRIQDIIEQELKALGPEYSDDNGFISMLDRDKTFAYLIAREAGITEYIPRQAIIRPGLQEAEPEAIATKLNSVMDGSEALIVKPRDAALGRGFVVLEKDDMEGFLAKFFAKKRSDEPSERFSDRQFDYYRRDIHKVCLVQEKIENLPVDEEGEIVSDTELVSKFYDPTARMVFKVVVSEQGIAVTPRIAYWKYPLARAYEGSIRRFRVASDTHTKRDGPITKLVPSAVFESAGEELSGMLKGLFMKFLHMDGRDLNEVILNQDNLTDFLTAVEVVNGNRIALCSGMSKEERDMVENGVEARYKELGGQGQILDQTLVRKLFATPYDPPGAPSL